MRSWCEAEGVRVTEELGITAALVRASGLVTDVCARVAAEHGVTAQQAQLLCVLAEHRVTMAQLGPMLRIAKSSTTGLVDRAEEAGLVARITVSDDRRSQQVTLTATGADLGAAYRADVEEQVAGLLRDVDAAGTESLRSVLSAVVLGNSARATWPRRDEATGPPPCTTPIDPTTAETGAR